MKKLSIFCMFLFVIGVMTSSAFAQIACNDDVDCDDGIECNGIETCDVDMCVEGESTCPENQICDIVIDECVDDVPVVSFDIKPGSCPNPLNVKSRGVLPVAILGTADFDVETINPETILITREGFDPVSPIRYSYDDVGAPSGGEPCECDDLDEDDLDVDDIMDLTLKFSVPELVEELGLKEVESREIIPLTIMVESEDGTLIMGEDCVKIINKFKWWDDFLEKIKKPKKPKNRDEE
jgi:hypothetical protein